MTVLLLFGGRSGEHDVSLRSAAYVLTRLAEMQTSVYAVGVERDGTLWLYRGDGAHLTAADWPRNRERVTLCYDGKARLLSRAGEELAFDAVFPLIHGRYGEDGALQGLLTLAGVPYVGCGILSSALCMYKPMAKRLAAAGGIPVLPWLCFRLAGGEGTEEAGLHAALRKTEEAFSYPVFVKPASGGSSVGAASADTREELLAALSRAAAADTAGEAMVEPFVHMREIEVAVLEKDGALLLPDAGEIDPAAPFYDYAAKYLTHRAKAYLPARLPQNLRDEVRSLAAEVFRLFGCRQMARVDFFADESGKIYFNEVNTVPGFTAESLYPRLLSAAGVDAVQALTESLDRGI